jgi:hypothetical protein
MRISCCRTLATIILFFVCQCRSQQPSKLRISGVGIQPLEINATELVKMPRVKLEVKDPHTGDTKWYEGVRLSDLLAKAGAPLGDKLRGSALATYVIARAVDGYTVVYSLAEVDPAMNGNQIIVADSVEGKPLDHHDGPFRVIVPGEKRAARWIRMVNAFELANPVNPSRSTQPIASSEEAVDDRKPVGGKVVFVEIPVVNYFAQGGEGTTELSPTDLMPGATGQARVKILKEGSVSVKAEFTGVRSATKFGNEFLTYILWGSGPNGQTLKIGELSLEGDRGQVVATTVLRNFAMLVTAEPYAAVTQPSNKVIFEGGSPSDMSQTTSAHISLMGDAYTLPGYNYQPLNTDSGYAPELIQAMNARRIAQVMQAQKYAPQQFENGENLYKYMMSSAIVGKAPSKDLLKNAKAVTETYEEARATSIRRQK